MPRDLQFPADPLLANSRIQSIKILLDNERHLRKRLIDCQSALEKEHHSASSLRKALLAAAGYGALMTALFLLSVLCR